jgi:hypothetical protein
VSLGDERAVAAVAGVLVAAISRLIVEGLQPQLSDDGVDPSVFPDLVSDADRPSCMR